jgi:hypothetical protein
MGVAVILFCVIDCASKHDVTEKKIPHCLVATCFMYMQFRRFEVAMQFGNELLLQTHTRAMPQR